LGIVCGRASKHSVIQEVNETRNDVHDEAAGKIKGAPLRKITLGCPKPVGNDAVYEEVPEEEEDEHRVEFHALGEGTGSYASAAGMSRDQEGRFSNYDPSYAPQKDAQKRDYLRDDSECELEHDEDRFGDSSLHGPGQHVLVFGYGVEVVCGSVPQPEFFRAADESVAQLGVESMIWHLRMQFCAV